MSGYTAGNGPAVSGLIPSIERRIDLQVATAKLAHRNTEHPEVRPPTRVTWRRVL
jgi:hypothetical protein